MDAAEEIKDIGNLLDSSPAVDDIELPGNSLSFINYISQGDFDGAAQEVLEPIKFRMHLPREDQELPESYSGFAVEDLKMLYNGTTLCMYATLPRPPEWQDVIPGGTSYDVHLMEVAAKAITEALSGTATDDRIVDLAPPAKDLAVYISCAVDPDAAKGRERLVTKDAWGVQVAVTVSSPEELDVAAWEVAVKMTQGFSSLYYAIQYSNRANRLLDQVDTYLKELSELHVELTAVAWWQIWRISRFDKAHAMRRLIASVLQTRIKLATAKIKADRAVSICSDLLMDNDVLNIKSDYFEKRLKRPASMDIESMLLSLRIYEEDSRTSFHLDVIVMAAVISAAVAGIIQLMGS